MKQYFEKGQDRPEFVVPPPVPFPEEGLSDEDVFSGVSERLSRNLSEIDRNFATAYVGPPHLISGPVAELASGTFFADWAGYEQAGTFQLERETTRMMGALLGHPEAVGFITSGGTESNVSALRYARNIAGVSEPEVIMPESGHYSLRLGAEVLGLRMREVPVGEDFKPDMDQIESLINPNTVALVCSAPDGAFGLLDPVADFADLAHRNGLYLHVDAAFGGFILPFMRGLGRDVPPFDFNLPGVSSIMTDGHKFGMMPVATSFLVLRDEQMLQAIPTERTLIHNMTATKHGEHAAIAWAVLNRMGRKGYLESASRMFELLDLLVEGIERIEGLRLVTKPFVPILAFTSDVYDLDKIHHELLARGWGNRPSTVRGVTFIRLIVQPNRDREHSLGFLNALEDSVQAARE